jgi:septal ring factor EnvC (AmiA/AmiB activator)
MAVATFDTLKFANTLKAAGVPDKQAEAQAVAFAEVIQINLKDLVTKDDLAAATKELKQEIADLRKETKQEFADVRKEIGDLRKELKQDITDARKETKDAEHRVNARLDTIAAQIKGEMLLPKWMFGAIVGMGAAILVRLFLVRGPLA